MAYGDFKDLLRRTVSDKGSHDGFQRGLASMAHKCFNEMSATTHLGRGIYSNLDSENQKLAKELQKPIIRKFGKRKVYSSFQDNIQGADPADMQ